MKRGRPFIIMVLCLFAASLAQAADGPILLPKKTQTSLFNFDFRPERNVTFRVAQPPEAAYRLAQTLLLELDYPPTAEAVARGDLIGPMLSKQTFGQGQLLEAVVVRLQPIDQGVELTIRALYVAPSNKYLLDQSGRQTSRFVRDFPELYAAKKFLVEATGEPSTHALIEQAKINLAARRDLEQTRDRLTLIVAATRPRCLAGRQARELKHAVEAEIERKQKLAVAVSEQKTQIEAAIAARDWLAAHRATDLLRHILIENQVPADDPLTVETGKTLARCRAQLRGRGPLLAFEPQTAPAEGNDVAVGFTVLNTGNRPVSAFKVLVATKDAQGVGSAGRIGPTYPYSVQIDPPLPPSEYYAATVVVRFEQPAEVATIDVRIVQIEFGNKPKN